MKTQLADIPWKVVKSDKGTLIGGTFGACIIPLEWHMEKEEEESVARLIAAAPELLEALQNLLNKDEMNQFDSFEAEKKAMAAIRKATGE